MALCFHYRQESAIWSKLSLDPLEGLGVTVAHDYLYAVIGGTLRSGKMGYSTLCGLFWDLLSTLRGVLNRKGQIVAIRVRSLYVVHIFPFEAAAGG